MELDKSPAVEPPKTRKRNLPKWTRISTPTGRLRGRSECWLLDISVLNVLVEGARPTALGIFDYSTRELLVWVIEARITISRMLNELDAWSDCLGAPSIIISDDSPEMRNPAIERWSAERGVRWQYENPTNLPKPCI